MNISSLLRKRKKMTIWKMTILLSFLGVEGQTSSFSKIYAMATSTTLSQGEDEA
jgi:hypothetical protein